MPFKGQGRQPSNTDPRARRSASALSNLDPQPPLSLDENGNLSIGFSKAGAGWGVRWDGRDVVSQPEFIVTDPLTRAYTAKVNELVLCDPTGAEFTVSLPMAAKCQGLKITIKNASASTNTITVATLGGALIDGAATVSMATAYLSLTFVSDGRDWWII